MVSLLEMFFGTLFPTKIVPMTFFKQLFSVFFLFQNKKYLVNPRVHSIHHVFLFFDFVESQIFFLKIIFIVNIGIYYTRVFKIKKNNL